MKVDNSDELALRLGLMEVSDSQNYLKERDTFHVRKRNASYLQNYMGDHL